MLKRLRGCSKEKGKGIRSGHSSFGSGKRQCPTTNRSASGLDKWWRQPTEVDSSEGGGSFEEPSTDIPFHLSSMAKSLYRFNAGNPYHYGADERTFASDRQAVVDGTRCWEPNDGRLEVIPMGKEPPHLFLHFLPCSAQLGFWSNPLCVAGALFSPFFGLFHGSQNSAFNYQTRGSQERDSSATCMPGKWTKDFRYRRDEGESRLVGVCP